MKRALFAVLLLIFAASLAAQTGILGFLSDRPSPIWTRC